MQVFRCDFLFERTGLAVSNSLVVEGVWPAALAERIRSLRVHSIANRARLSTLFVTFGNEIARETIGGTGPVRSEKAFQWSWSRSHAVSLLPASSIPTALRLRLGALLRASQQ